MSTKIIEKNKLLKERFTAKAIKDIPINYCLVSYACIFEPDFKQLEQRVFDLDPESNNRETLFDTQDLRGRLATVKSSKTCKVEDLPNGLHLFAFPEGLKLYNEMHPPQYHSFVLTDLTGNRLYGYCYSSWFIMPDEILGLARAEIGLSAPLPTAVYGPYSFCVLSPYPFHKAFKSFVLEFCSIYDTVTSGRIDNEMAAYAIKCLSHAVTDPSKRYRQNSTSDDQINNDKDLSFAQVAAKNQKKKKKKKKKMK